MNKTDFRKRPYTAPWCMTIETEVEFFLLAGSPKARPGGDAGGTVSVGDFDEDNGGDDDVIEAP
ncbi:hypothetical protein HMPREF9140_00381 [Prevotella micans F0438]|uniref:Uncharacterized protein n=1 Tax=Prevotella micans F0438 TaxID=883158 RepID=H1Q0E3_9BACT|nr:hypothetical protein [Prevotella micans]EHO73672.1 hypothetical protein HMPREF9140_00381 [Prevotella micans F0438]